MFARGNLLFLFAVSGLIAGLEAGIIKDIYQKITHTNNKTEETVKQSAPICGSGTFSTPDERTLSPEFIFITNRPIKSNSQHASGGREDDRNQRESARRRDQVSEVAREFRFHGENVTLEELERHGFNRDAPVSFLMHGFTSGYPLQAWISAIVEAYTIDRQSPASQSSYQDGDQNYAERSRESPRRRNNSGENSNARVNHNLFIINWNYAARGILYPRAVANIPIVASYATRFINDKLLGEAGVEPRRVQLIGHSLGAHLAGFIGKNTKSKLGRIYGLDPAGPCFGTLSGPLYPASKRLAPGDAEEVITVHTNTALLGIDKPIGKYSVFVEGGSVQPGCKGGGVFKSLQTLTWDGGDFDTIACSHSRAPNLLTYRHDQSDTEDDCQLVAYECKDWDSFVAGHCGVCRDSAGSTAHGSSDRGPSRSVECLRIGLDWQYPKSTSSSSGSHSSASHTTRRPAYGDDSDDQNYNTSSKRPAWSNGYDQYSTSGYGDNDNTRRPYGQGGHQSTSGSAYEGGGYYDTSSTRRPHSGASNNQQSSYAGQNDRENAASTRRPQSSSGYSEHHGDGSSRRPDSNYSGGGSSSERLRRAANSSSERRGSEQSVESKSLFLRTGDTQPYCAYQYQVILELSEPFPKRKPPMSLVLQDSEGSSRDKQGQPQSASRAQNSLSNDEFGNKFDDKTYTHLLTSGKKLGRIDHATLLFRDGLPDGLRLLKSMQVNYMSHIDPAVRRRLSVRLCPVRKNPGGQSQDFSTDKRFYFEPCADGSSNSNSGQSSYHHGSGRERDSEYGGSSGRRPNRER